LQGKPSCGCLPRTEERRKKTQEMKKTRNTKEKKERTKKEKETKSLKELITLKPPSPKKKRKNHLPKKSGKTHKLMEKFLNWKIPLS
jgi:hypothetical protein